MKTYPKFPVPQNDLKRNGTLKLPLPMGKYYTVIGGPSHAAESQRRDRVFVKLAAEINISCDINIPTPDFSVPAKRVLDEGLYDAVHAITSGKAVYVGCMAGRGRTGLFLAILAKAFGVKNPVEYVRDTYYAHAVETKGQYAFVEDYKIPEDVKALIRNARWKSVFKIRRQLTNGGGQCLKFKKRR